jgi:ABC-type spermidine/putrescine transport system permease subunit I
MTIVFLVPILVIVWLSFASPNPGNYVDAWESELFRRSILTTLEMAVGVTAICIVAGYPFAYVLARGGKIIRTMLFVALMTSFWTSTLVRTYAWQIMLNNTGFINKALLDLGLIDQPIRMIHTQFAVFLTMAQILLPFAVLTTFAAIRSINPDLERAAQVMGARPSVAFFRVTVPLSLPGAAAGGVLVFVIALGFYITPSIVGASNDLYIGSLIVQQLEVYRSAGGAAAQSVVLLVIALGLLAVAARFVGLGRVLGLRQGGSE